MDTETPIDRIIQEEDPSGNFEKQPAVEEMQMPLQGQPAPAQMSALGKLKEYFGTGTGSMTMANMAIIAFVLVLLVFNGYVYYTGGMETVKTGKNMMTSVVVAIVVALLVAFGISKMIG